MRPVKTLAALLVSVLVLVGCSDDATIPTTGADDASNIETLLGDLQEAANTLEKEVADSAVADDLSVAWNEVEADVDHVVASVAGGADELDDDVSASLDEFESRLADLGEEAGDAVAAAWAEFRAAFDDVLDELDLG